MRKYLRHPTDIPIRYRIDDNDAHKEEFLQNVGHGGLCFISKNYIEPNTEIEIHIPIRKPEFISKALVIWCRKTNDDAFRIGVKFKDEHEEFHIRMIEQICYIEHYRMKELLKQGRELSGTEAASEWISKYAGKFAQNFSK